MLSFFQSGCSKALGTVREGWPGIALEIVSSVLFIMLKSSLNTNWYYYHYNAHGDVVAVTDGSGNVHREYVYDPYGNILSVKKPRPIMVEVGDLKTDSFKHVCTYGASRQENFNYRRICNYCKFFDN